MSDSFAPSWTIAHQAPLSMGFSRQEHLQCCHFLFQGIFPTQDWTFVSCTSSTGRRILYHCHLEAQITWCALSIPSLLLDEEMLSDSDQLGLDWGFTLEWGGGASLSLDHTLPSSFASLLCLNHLVGFSGQKAGCTYILMLMYFVIRDFRWHLEKLWWLEVHSW